MYRNQFLLLTIALLFFCGCDPKLSVVKEKELAPGSIESIVIDPISSEQEITVEATGDDLFHVHVFLTEDQESVDRDIAQSKAPSKALGGALEKKTHSFKAKIPANKEAQVRLETATGNTFKVTVKINN